MSPLISGVAANLSFWGRQIDFFGAECLAGITNGSKIRTKSQNEFVL
jgi:hypothetical protein